MGSFIESRTKFEKSNNEGDSKVCIDVINKALKGERPISIWEGSVSFEFCRRPLWYGQRTFGQRFLSIVTMV